MNAHSTGNVAKIVIVTLLLSLTLAGCKSKHTSDSDATVYIVNGIPGSTELKATTEDHTFTGPGFGANVLSLHLPAGAYSLGMSAKRSDGAISPLPPIRIHPLANHKYALIVQARRASFCPIPVSVKSNESQVTVVNATADPGAIDITVNSIVSFAAISSGSASQSTSLEPGTYEIAVLASGDLFKSLSEPVQLKLRGAKSYSLFVVGGASDHGLVTKLIEN
ncbi:MAG TPA: DUF4397 domain-containing protein [Capsulimonadaceae bacterium]